MEHSRGDGAWRTCDQLPKARGDTAALSERKELIQPGTSDTRRRADLLSIFRVGHIRDVALTGLSGAPFLDFASGAAGEQKVDRDEVLQITKETNRVYPDSTATVEILDRNLMRAIRVEKFHSRSTVVWNPWTTQKLPDDFDPAEHQQMVCVESGNVKQNKLTLAPGEQTTLKAVLSTAPLLPR